MTDQNASLNEVELSRVTGSDPQIQREIDEWLDRVLIEDPNKGIPAAALYDAFRREHPHYKRSLVAFGWAVRRAGYRTRKLYWQDGDKWLGRRMLPGYRFRPTYDRANSAEPANADCSEKVQS